jgi:hypothetical protein
MSAKLLPYLLGEAVELDDGLALLRDGLLPRNVLREVVGFDLGPVAFFRRS